jgi:hypothetical protein
VAAIAALYVGAPEFGIVRLSTEPLGKAFVNATVSCCGGEGSGAV